MISITTISVAATLLLISSNNMALSQGKQKSSSIEYISQGSDIYLLAVVH